MNPILHNALQNQRISSEEALYLLQEVPWTELAQAAHQKRMQMHPENKVGYTAYRIINYTNICNIFCSFCSFYRHKSSPEAYILSKEQIQEKALEVREMGVDQIFLQGGVHPDIPLNYYTEVLEMLTQKLGFSVRGFSPVELVYIAKANRLSTSELLDIFKDAGLSSVPGAGAEILSDNMRERLSPKKLRAQEWAETMSTCHQKGLKGSANIVFGSNESPQDIIEHLEIIRQIQDETHGFLSFVAWTFQPQTPYFPIRHVKAKEYLKIIALSRLFFDNIQHIEVSLLGMGLTLGELGLHSGANDINSIVIEENVLVSQGLKTIQEAEDFIQNAGFTPYYRSLNFN
ncbi:MAG: CofH family radical SAM protein [Fibrobacter sp.]|jgi:cyclic dehypoxanthinyl futalosine synthase|nr:CofH family radical SAM protein [Fibrobacter sp.]